MKRKWSADEHVSVEETKTINPSLVKEWDAELERDSRAKLMRNAIVSVGTDYALIDAEERRRVTHIFLSSLKEQGVKATDQGQSGRCWLFAGLNVFRHAVISALDTPSFEFSQTYLYFWDKLERANYWMRWHAANADGIDIDTGEGSAGFDLETPEMNYMFEEYLSDGGYWNMFQNLIVKYGVVPKTAMPETWHSGLSADLNNAIKDRLAAYLAALRAKSSEPELLIKTTLETIYKTLVIFLGKPPQSFTWFYSSSSGEGCAMKATVDKFSALLEVFAPSEFVELCNYPHLLMHQPYQLKWTSNMIGGKPMTMLNLPIHELKKYTNVSLESNKLPVWFSGDVSKQFSFPLQALNTKLHSPLMEGLVSVSKADRVRYHVGGGTHAMVFTGVNLDERNRPIAWQVENSWGYADEDTPGQDGFLTMSDDWFTENVYSVVVHRKFLSRTVLSLLDKEPIVMLPWSSAAKFMMTSPHLAPRKMIRKQGVHM